jgi:predicted enzyme related to lactoylglutathione lyase
MASLKSRSSHRPAAKPARAGARSRAQAKAAPAKAAPAKAASVKAAKKRAAPARKAAVSAPRAAARAEAPAVANAIGLVNHHLDYTSHDLDGVKRFYTELLGFSQSQHDPTLNYLYIQTSGSSSLGFMPPMPGPPEDWRPPREPALYFMVEDVDRAHQALVDRGVEFDQAPRDMPWGHRVAILMDPEGRRVCLAQNLGR